MKEKGIPLENTYRCSLMPSYGYLCELPKYTKMEMFSFLFSEKLDNNYNISVYTCNTQKMHTICPHTPTHQDSYFLQTHSALLEF